MCTYGLSADEIKDDFENWLADQEGEIDARTIAKAWNMIAKKQGWSDRLYARYIK